MAEETMESPKERVALYGLGTETERLISEKGDELDVVCLLDGYRQDGEMYGYSIKSVEEAVEEGVKKIIVVARPGSCKAIARRIKEICITNAITLLDVRGNDLLVDNRVIYDFKDIKAGTKTELIEAIDNANVVSFDLFDTLVMRKVFSYTDVFDLVDLQLKKQGIKLDSFANRRLAFEKELSVNKAPKLVEIYEKLLGEGENISYDALAKIEWEVDRDVLISRTSMIDVFKYAIKHGKRVFITTDSYYPKEWIISFLNQLEICGYEDVLVSCEYGVSKNQGLFEILKNITSTSKILHIGDDEYADIEMAKRYGIDSFRIFSAKGLYEYLGELGVADDVLVLADRVKVGLFISYLFEDPFMWEMNNAFLHVRDSYDIGYLFCASIITDFSLWMKEQAKADGINMTLLCARDGYLLKKLFSDMGDGSDVLYFLTSRMSTIRAGVRTDAEIAYVDSMKFFGNPEEELRVRYGISEVPTDAEDRVRMILDRSAELRENYIKYSKRMGVPQNGTVGIFDFVAKGTSQMFLRNILTADLKGYYFLQLEPEFMADKGLDIKPFYSKEEKEHSEIFNSYYILETILTSPDPSVVEFDQNGMPLFDKETRSEHDIKCVLRAQSGIEDFFKDYIRILNCAGINDYCSCINKKLDEKLLSFIGKVDILDSDFKNLVVEDPFFGRMTNVTDVIG